MTGMAAGNATPLLAICNDRTYRPIALTRRGQRNTTGLLTQATMLVRLAGALAVSGHVGRMQAMGTNRFLDVELADVGLNDHATLIDQQRANRKP
jgi:hypothetical protein